MHKLIFLLVLFFSSSCRGQQHTSTLDYNDTSLVETTTKYNSTDTIISVVWACGNGSAASLTLDLDNKRPLFRSIELSNKKITKTIARNLDPKFILTVGKRDLVSQNGWNIFFDKVPDKPFQSYKVELEKRNATVTHRGSRIIVRIDGMKTPTFSGVLEITAYIGSPLFNIAAVLSTNIDSTAIVYDAGLVSKTPAWSNIAWSNTTNELQTTQPQASDTSKNIEVKYRSLIGENPQGSLAIFPAPHQYFYPLDEAFNLKFVWYGSNYRKMIPEYGIGIRQDLYGDRRYVPWFNAPPGTNQRLNFFCLLSTEKAITALQEVKKFTHEDKYVSMPGYKTMSSHFHNEFIMSVVLAGKPVPEKPNFVTVFKNTGVDIVHLGEFHYTAHPKGPDEQRLKELKALFDQCRRLSGKDFLLLPGEEPNEFFGGHWMEFFPKPVYWIMSRKPGMPFVTEDPTYGKIYRVSDKDEMLKLLQAEKGLAWTAHARTKGSTGFPDKYKEEAFYKSDRFMGAAWKAIPADLSTPTLSRRVFDLMDDMNNWGLKKHVIAEADLFSIEPANELYAHLNVNYLQLDRLPNFNSGWQPVLDVMEKGRFFSTTGEILLPTFSVNGKAAGETLQLDQTGKADVTFTVNWTFPLNFADIIFGDGKQVYRKRINLNYTTAFGSQKFSFPVVLKNMKWIRAEVWDAAVNGAFTQSIWLK